jgi:HK97 family phage prohead protease
VNGAQGKPLCYKHRRNDVVGQVHHSYLDANNNLKITAKIPARTPRGQRVIAKIRAGKLNGFSVGYDNNIENGVITDKVFHEISICKEPFFDGCNVEGGVFASNDKPAGK